MSSGPTRGRQRSDPGSARGDLSKRACGNVSGGAEVQMAVDPELLEILVCPKTKGALELVPLPEKTRGELVEKYREHFRDEDPVVEEGLYCAESKLVYPIVSDIPIMLVEEALPAESVLG